MIHTYVLAGQARHVERFFDALGVRPVPGQIVFVHDVKQLHGICDGSVLIELETATEIQDYWEILKFLRGRGVQHIHLSLDAMLGIKR